MRVEQIWRYPVKSMAGERLESAFVSRRGIPGDRGWAVWDEERGGVTNAKRLPALRALRPRYLTEPVSGEASLNQSAGRVGQRPNNMGRTVLHRNGGFDERVVSIHRRYVQLMEGLCRINSRCGARGSSEGGMGPLQT